MLAYEETDTPNLLKACKMTRKRRNTAKQMLQRLNKNHSGLLKFDSISSQSKGIDCRERIFGLSLCRPVNSKQIVNIWDEVALVEYLAKVL